MRRWRMLRRFRLVRLYHVSDVQLSLSGAYKFAAMNEMSSEEELEDALLNGDESMFTPTGEGLFTPVNESSGLFTPGGE
jgi:hypothetical protein